MNLPPLRLTWSYSAKYPSREPPGLNLECDWLHPAQLDGIREKLIKIFYSDVGNCVIYQWHVFLSNELLTLLQLPPRFKVSYMKEGSGLHPVALENIQENTDGVLCEERRSHDHTWHEEDIALVHERVKKLMNFDADEGLRKFKMGQHTCLLCFDNLLGSKFQHLSCGHVFCSSCMSDMAEIHIKEGAIDQLVCPDPDCREAFPYNVVSALVGPDLLDRWQEFSRKKEVEQLEGVRYCPRCDPASIVWDGYKKILCTNYVRDGTCR